MTSISEGDDGQPPLQPTAAPAQSQAALTKTAQPAPASPQQQAARTQTMPTVVPRAAVTSIQAKESAVDLTAGDFETNLGALLNKDLQIAEHDRAVATALLKVHIDRADVLDGMALSMPVASVIADNTGATLKSLELAMRAGERVHKIAELLVAAKRGDDANAINALKAQLAMRKDGGEDGWDGTDLPSQ